MNDTTHTTPQTRRWPWVAGIAAALFVGMGIGGASADSSPEQPEPEVITETETVTEEVEVVPAVCIEALDASESLTHDSFIPAFDAVIDVLNAAAVMDVAGIEEASGTIEDLAEDVGPRVDAYNTAASECRQAAK